MRLHPSLLSPFRNRWHFGVAFVLLFGVIVLEVHRNKAEPEPAQATMEIPLRRVIVAKVALKQGTPISHTDLVYEDRPVPTLPADVISNFDEIKGMIPIGVIPAKYPLAKSLLKAPPTPVVEKPPPVDLVELKLKPLRQSTVGIDVVFSGEPPERGKRIAITIQGKEGGSALLAEEGWVDSVVGKNMARVLLSPQTALFFNEAIAFGSLSYLVIPDQGESPFTGKAVTSTDELKELFKPKPVVVEQPTNVAPVAKESPRAAGYAWVPGESIRYSVGKDGSINILDKAGKEFPINDLRKQTPSADVEHHAPALPAGTTAVVRGVQESP